MDNNMNQQGTQPTMNFDPMTGQPIYNGTPVQPQTPPVQPQTQPQDFVPVQPQTQPQDFVPMQPQMEMPPYQGMPQGMMPMQPPKKKAPVGAIIGICIGVIVIIAAVVIGILVYKGVFLSPQGKFMRAAENTFGETGSFMEALDTTDIMKDGNYTTTIDIDMEDIVLHASMAMTESTKALDVEMSSSELLEGMGIEAGMILDKDKVSVQIPTIGDDVYVYNYNDAKTGYITEIMTEEEIEMIDSLLEAAASGETDMSFATELIDAWEEEFDKMEFEDLSKRSFVIDGKSRECKGYTTTITPAVAKGFVNVMEPIYKEMLGASYDESYDEIFSELSMSLDEMPTFDLTFYIYKNQFASIGIVVEGQTMEVLFMGGDRPMQNMKVLVSGIEVLTVTGTVSGSTETTTVSAMGMELLAMSYDSKSGVWSIDVDVEDVQVAASGTLTRDRGSISLGITSLEMDGLDLGLDCSVSLEKGADIEEFDGTVIDIGTASESMFLELFEEIENALY